MQLNGTSLSNGVSVVDGYKVTMASAGKYNIAFSSQLDNAAPQRRIVTIWLSKNGTDAIHWVPETSTDIYLATDVTGERDFMALNFFVDAQAGDYYVLMVVANGDRTIIHGGTSANTLPAGIPAVPSTILTVNQVG